MYNVQYAKPQGTKKRVYYIGTDTLKEGYPLCYNFDATTVDYRNKADSTISVGTYAAARRLCVEKPAEGNKLHFAGVVAAESDAKSTGWITLWLPGSVCNVYAYANCDHGATGLTTNTGQTLNFCPGKYYFMDGGFQGEGAATILQDIDRSTTPGLVMAELQTGKPTGGYQVVHLLSTATAGAISVSLSTPCAYVGVYAFTGDSVDFVYPGETATTLAATMSILVNVADAHFIGQRVKFISEDALSGGVICCIISTAAKQAICVGGTLQCSGYVDLSAANNYIDLTWNGHSWVVNCGVETYGLVGT